MVCSTDIGNGEIIGLLGPNGAGKTTLIYSLVVKNYKNADRLGTVYGIVSMILAGVWFSMPESGILNFLSLYCNPLSLGQNAVYAFVTGENVNKAIISMSILFCY